MRESSSEPVAARGRVWLGNGAEPGAGRFSGCQEDVNVDCDDGCTALNSLKTTDCTL